MVNALKTESITPEMIQANFQNSGAKTIIENPDIDNAIELMSKLNISTESGYVIRPLGYDYVRQFDKDTLNLVMQLIGLYTFPTIELIKWLKSQIDDDQSYEPYSAIEICAGTGWIGRSLGIPITDSKLQEDPNMVETYLSMGAIPIEYPNDVEKLEAMEAVNKYHPDIVIGSYVTSKWGMKGSNKKYGNAFGVNTLNVIRNCYEYILIGNDSIHGNAPEMKLPHERLSFPWLITRGDVSKARIYIWKNKNWFK